jgi:hypothetical protein
MSHICLYTSESKIVMFQRCIGCSRLSLQRVVKRLFCDPLASLLLLDHVVHFAAVSIQHTGQPLLLVAIKRNTDLIFVFLGVLFLIAKK